MSAMLVNAVRTLNGIIAVLMIIVSVALVSYNGQASIWHLIVGLITGLLTAVAVNAPSQSWSRLNAT